MGRRSRTTNSGCIAHEQRDFAGAEQWYRKSLEIKERRGDEHGAASTYGQLGILAGFQERWDEAARWLDQVCFRISPDERFARSGSDRTDFGSRTRNRRRTSNPVSSRCGAKPASATYPSRTRSLSEIAPTARRSNLTTPPTIVAIARPFTCHPRNGVLL